MRHTLMSALSLALAASLGCATPPPPPAPVTKVKAESLRVEERDITPQQFTAVVVTALDNTGDQEVKTIKALYEIVTEGTVVGTGEIPVNAVIPPGQEIRAEIPVTVLFSQIARTDDSKSISFAVRGQLLLTDGQVEFARAGGIRAPLPPTLDVVAVDMSGSDKNGLSATAQVTVNNSNSYNFPMRQLRWKLWLDGKEFGDGAVGVNSSVRAGATTTFSFSVLREPSELKQQGIKVTGSFGYKLDLVLEGDEGSEIPVTKTGTAILLRG